jgi:predicted MPP superfamily phosphohydrolase
MRRAGPIGLVILILVLALAEYYTFTALRFAMRNWKPGTKNVLTGVYIVVSLLWVGSFFLFPYLRSGEINKTLRNIIISFAMGLLIMKLLIAVVLLIDDLRRFLFYLGSLGLPSDSTSKITEGISRSTFMNNLALILGGGIFGSLLLGLTNKYRYKIRSVALSFTTLPKAFHNFRVVQISDIHSGSLHDKEAIRKGIEKINALQPDIIFFTGDLVNNTSDEMLPFMDVFNQLKAKHGVYSVLGNHDYGDYHTWDSASAKRENLNQLKSIHAELGWKLLLNEHRMLEHQGEQIAIIGVENTSFSGRFQNYGDLQKAYTGSEIAPFKILLSHDPSHWDGEVNSKYTDIHLTLSGHTHGMQFGIDIPGFQWSPVKYFYKQWAGLYSKNDQHIYVNRGFGFLGYPGRVGIMPEITFFELKSS